MKNIISIIIKEFKQIFRDRGMLPIIILLPIIQLFVLAHAATFDIKNLKMYIVDSDKSSISRELISKFEASSYFLVTDVSSNKNLANEKLHIGEIDLILEIPDNLEKYFINQTDKAEVSLNINAIDGTKAGLASYYSNSIINDLNFKHAKLNLLVQGYEIKNTNISTEPQFWYNMHLDYKTFMVPGILALLITMIGTFLATMNLVKEKEIGTIEQINVSPIKKYQFLIGKLVPLWILAMFELAFGLVLSKIMYDIPMLGNPLVLFGFTGIYLFACVGLGLLISTISDTQQQAMFITWFLLMIFILLSGLFTSTKSMPEWIQYLNYLNPIKYMIDVIRMVMLKGSDFKDIADKVVAISIFAVTINTIAVLKYKKTI